MKKEKVLSRQTHRGNGNRKHKDRLFRMVFRDRKDLLDLYNAINGTYHINEEELTVTTLDDVFFLDYKDDLSFLVFTMGRRRSRIARSFACPAPSPWAGARHWSAVLRCSTSTTDITKY